MSDESEYALSQLIADLQVQLAEHGDVPVDIEGCDCNGKAVGVDWAEGGWPSDMEYRCVVIKRGAAGTS